MGRPLVVLTGKKIGLWTVRERDPVHGKPRFRCECACGTVKSVLAHSLREGTTLSCGCTGLARRKANDLSGKRFGRWTVVCRDASAPKQAGKHARWMCNCDCGETRGVIGTMLLRGGSRSCGCLQAEEVADRSVVHGRYGTPEHQAHLSAIRRARKSHATPLWADREKIRVIYEMRPDGYEVDHIVPLAGKLVCGLHCEFNLQYLTKAENARKRNCFLV